MIKTLLQHSMGNWLYNFIFYISLKVRCVSIIIANINDTCPASIGVCILGGLNSVQTCAMHKMHTLTLRFLK